MKAKEFVGKIAQEPLRSTWLGQDASSISAKHSPIRYINELDLERLQLRRLRLKHRPCSSAGYR